MLDNAFGWIADFERAQKLADQFSVEVLVTVQTAMIVDFGEGGGWVWAGPGDDSESQPVNS